MQAYSMFCLGATIGTIVGFLAGLLSCYRMVNRVEADCREAKQCWHKAIETERRLKALLVKYAEENRKELNKPAADDSSISNSVEQRSGNNGER